MKLLFKRLLSFIPVGLPDGMAAFELWADSIIELLPEGLANVPKDDKYFVLASAVQHLGQTQAYMPKHHFVKLMRKAAASQVASQVFLNIKAKQQEAAKAAELAAQQPVEVTTSPVAPNVENPKV